MNIRLRVRWRVNRLHRIRRQLVSYMILVVCYVYNSGFSSSHRLRSCGREFMQVQLLYEIASSSLFTRFLSISSRRVYLRALPKWISRRHSVRGGLHLQWRRHRILSRRAHPQLCSGSYGQSAVISSMVVHLHPGLFVGVL